MTQQPPLFGGVETTAPATQGIKYAGSKLKVIPHILRLARKVDARTVLDGFSGSTRVSQALARAGYQVYANDIAAWSATFATCFLLNQRPVHEYQALVDHLNNVPPVDGWFTEHYGGHANGGCAVQHDGLKKPWQIHNTRKLDGIRQEIDSLELDSLEESVALTGLVLALDRVDSTLGHFVSYLRDWSPRSYGHLTLRVPQLFVSDAAHRVYQQDIFELVPRVRTDLAYLDPPYGSNNEKMPPSRVRYASYYHVWKSVCLNDQPALFGKAKRRADSRDALAGSVFEEFRRGPDGRYIAVEAVDRLLKAVQARWILLSYSSGGRATAEELDHVVRANGRLLDVVAVDHSRHVMSNMTWTDEWVGSSCGENREYLFLIEKG